MKYVEDMLNARPSGLEIDQEGLSACIEACFECEQVCTACADACLAEDMVAELRHCIRTDLDCADICATTGRILSRQTKPDWDLVRAQVEALEQAVRSCGDECARHAEMHEHCRICMETCRRCAEACQNLLQMLPEGAVA